MPAWTALLPMKEHSERVPGKNMRNFCAKPLFHHILETLYLVSLIKIVVVDTDSEFIKDSIKKFYPKTLVLDRPHSLRGDFISMNQIIDHDLKQIEGEYFIQTHCTNPLLNSFTIEQAMEEFYEKRNEYDSAFSVTRKQSRFYKQDASPLNHEPESLLRTQDLEPIYEENSAFYLFSRASFYRSNKHRIGAKSLMCEIPRIEAVDIDEEEDFLIAESLYIQKSKQDTHR